MPRRALAALAAVLSLYLYLPAPAKSELALRACDTSPADRRALAAQAELMFDHAYAAYETHAHPADELLPLSCSPTESFAGLSVTLIDSLDAFVVMRQWSRFASAVKYVTEHVSFAVDDTVSVFETNIRVLGGLLSAHGFLTEGFEDTGFRPEVWCPWYDGGLLVLARDLADRLMPAFDTPTGIPFGAVHLIKGVDPGESRVASTAGAGSLLLEFGTLSRYVSEPKYYRAAFNAMHALFKRSSKAGLVGNHINIMTGDWVAAEAGVGGLVDSYYEYMLKGYILFGDHRLLRMFRASYEAIETYLHKKPWYLDADMWSGHTSSLTYSSLAAFWPAVQVLFGEVEDAIETTRAHYSVWRRYGCLPEGYQVIERKPAHGRVNYPLRPELVESVFYLHWATNDSSWVSVAKSMMFSIEELTRVKCGYAAIKNASTHLLEDLMPSFVMSETFKYLYLVFSGEDDEGKVHWARSGNYVFTTEAHPLRVVTEDVRDILGANFDKESSGEEEFDTDLDDRGKSSLPQQKCKRRPEIESKLPCGYSMPGTDFPNLDPASLVDPTSSFGITPVIAESVTAQLRKLAENEGGRGGVNVGDVVFGEGWACRVVKIDGAVVSFERLDGVEAHLEKERKQGGNKLWVSGQAGTCKRGSAFDAVRHAARSGGISEMRIYGRPPVPIDMEISGDTWNFHPDGGGSE